MVTWHVKQSLGSEETSGGSIKRYYYLEGECVSTDDKPTGSIGKPTDFVGNGSKLIEMDSSTVYMYDADSETWIEWGN